MGGGAGGDGYLALTRFATSWSKPCRGVTTAGSCTSASSTSHVSPSGTAQATIFPSPALDMVAEQLAQLHKVALVGPGLNY